MMNGGDLYELAKILGARAAGSAGLFSPLMFAYGRIVRASSMSFQSRAVYYSNEAMPVTISDESSRRLVSVGRS